LVGKSQDGKIIELDACITPIKTNDVAKADVGISTNLPSVESVRLSKLEVMVINLEIKLIEANMKVAGLQTELHNEKTKNISTTSDDTKKRDSSSFEKLNFKTGALIKRTTKPPLLRNKSSDVYFRTEFNKIKKDSQEDEEFRRLETQAIYEAKIEKIFTKNSRKQSIKDTLQTLKSPIRQLNISLTNHKSHNSFVKSNYSRDDLGYDQNFRNFGSFNSTPNAKIS
jgi:hypothetical protein